MTIQEEFAGYRARGLTVAELSRRSGFSDVTVNKFITGKYVCDDTETKIRNALKQYDVDQVNHLKKQGLV